MGVINNVVTESNGAKRGLSGVISTLGLLTLGIPGFSIVTSSLSWLGGLVGLGGLIHAGTESNLGTNKTQSLAAIFAVLLTLCNTIPALNQYASIIQEIAGFLGIGVALKSVAKSS